MGKGGGRYVPLGTRAGRRYEQAFRGRIGIGPPEATQQGAECSPPPLGFRRVAQLQGAESMVRGAA